MEKTLRIGYLTILALMPVHALLTVWLISNLGHDTLISAWKEILLALLVPLAAGLLLARRDVAKTIFNRRINQLILAYTFLHFVVWMFTRVELDAAAAGMLINLRFFAIFVLAQILVASRWKLEDREEQAVKLRSQAGKIVLAGAIVVSIIGALQLLILPADILTHFGYGPETIEPYRTIDQNEDYVRVNSTLRGPNPLGLYMILALPLLLLSFIKLPKAIAGNWQLVDWKKLRSRFPSSNLPTPLLYLLVLTGLITLYASHSRTGWLGAAIALALLLWLILKPKLKRPLALIGLGLLLTTGLLLLGFSQTDFVQHTILHQDPAGGTVVDSTAKHWQASGRGLQDIADNPLGEGPGSAGPASFYNDEQTKIAENYFIQLGQEVGLVGLALFIAINALAARALIAKRQHSWPKLLLASFAGLTIANLFLHAWAQDEIALIWWGLAGLYYEE